MCPMGRAWREQFSLENSSGEEEEEEGAVLGGTFWNGEAKQVLGLDISKCGERLAVGKCSPSQRRWEGVTPKYTAEPTGHNLCDVIP